MTKRFILDDAGELIDLNNHKFIDYGEECCNLLNELHEETQSSKEFIEQLQEELVLFKKAGTDMGIDLNTQITALKQENEQLKKQIEELKVDLKMAKIDGAINRMAQRPIRW